MILLPFERYIIPNGDRLYFFNRQPERSRCGPLVLHKNYIDIILWIYIQY